MVGCGGSMSTPTPAGTDEAIRTATTGGVTAASLEARLETFERDLKELKTPKPKDRWDKLGAVSSLISGGLIALVGIGATALYNRATLEQQRQNQEASLRLQAAQTDAANALQRVQVIEKFFGHFVDKDSRVRSAALEVVAAIDPKLAASLGGYFRDAQAAPLLQQLSRSPNKETAALATSVLVSLQEPDRIKAIVNIFEIGQPNREYGQVTVIPGDTGHLTYGAAATTLGSGNLHWLIKAYTDQPGAIYGEALKEYLPRLEQRDVTLDQDPTFRTLLTKAGDDPIMQAQQDRFFDRVYFAPAQERARALGITTPLGLAVVYDSTVHGGFRAIQEKTTQELRGTPLTGVDERKWIATYVKNRREFLANNPNERLRRSVYRMDTFQQIINDGNWELKPPFSVRGFTIG